MKNVPKRFVSLVITVAMMLSLGLYALAEDETSCCYNYVLISRPAVQGTIVLELYVAVERADDGPADPDHPAGPLLDAGAFGLCFPEWLKDQVVFTPDEKISLHPIVPEERLSLPGMDASNLYGDYYHAFNWTERMDGSPLGTIHKAWMYQTELNGYGLSLGRYTISLPVEEGTPRLPNKTDISQLDWLTIPEAIAKEVGDTVADGSDLLNRTLWNPETKLYQGYYADPDADPDIGAPPVQTDIGFRFEPPEEWPSEGSTMTLRSYDPKKFVRIELRKWDEASGKYEESAAYVLEIPGASEGINVCVQEIAFQDAKFIYEADGSSTMVKGWELPSGRYEIEVRKAGHVGGYRSGVTVSREGGEVQVFPELDGQTLTLPCGDVTGDGRIRQADRAELTRPGRYMSAVEAGNVYDLNGDGRIDQKDLAILTSPANYGKNDFKKGFTKQEGPTETTKVGENGV